MHLPAVNRHCLFRVYLREHGNRPNYFVSLVINLWKPVSSISTTHHWTMQGNNISWTVQPIWDWNWALINHWIWLDTGDLIVCYWHIALFKLFQRNFNYCFLYVEVLKQHYSLSQTSEQTMSVAESITVAATAPAGYTLYLEQAVGQEGFFGRLL